MVLNKKIVLPGGAGLVGQNLVAQLKFHGYTNIVVLDKHEINLDILQQTHPDILCVLVDLADKSDWSKYFENADVVVMLQAQIGGIDFNQFVRNNIDSTKNVIDVMKDYNISNIIHISSSVVESVANDFYSVTKNEQEKLILNSGFCSTVLRPTLMYGWFDRKHLGWLSRFMQNVPIFPIPGHGRYMRQPLYVRDFSNIIISCINDPSISGSFNISGHEKIDYIDMIREIKISIKSKSLILKIPYSLFHFLLWLWALFDKNPPFTTQQLDALCAEDEFEVFDWPSFFNVKYTPFKVAIDETFNHPVYSNIVLKF
jgi:nucleoside-diphosphate-sugar epimerase